MSIYKADTAFSEEYLNILNSKRKAYPLGTEIHCTDGVVLMRVRKGFTDITGF